MFRSPMEVAIESDGVVSLIRTDCCRVMGWHPTKSLVLKALARAKLGSRLPNGARLNNHFPTEAIEEKTKAKLS